MSHKPDLTKKTCGGQASSVFTKSFANPEDAKTVGLLIKWRINFERKVIEGEVSYRIRKTSTADRIIFDTWNLTIFSAHVTKLGEDDTDEGKLEFFEVPENIGKSLIVFFPPSEENHIEITIKYETCPTNPAFIWSVRKDFTSGEKFEQLYTHAESLYCRAVFPCQDTPDVRITFVAEITLPKNFNAFMGGVHKDNCAIIRTCENSKVKQFKQSIPVPAYMVSLIAGKPGGHDGSTLFYDNFRPPKVLNIKW